MSILIIAEHDNQNLKGATLNTVAAAKKLGESCDVLVAGENCEAVAQSCASLPGVVKVLHADNRRIHLLEVNPLPGAPAPDADAGGRQG